ncbi:MAG: acyltransferase domain-containing protein [Candidatus Aminicenantes bacterium]|nr:acyltransferase domain-containing protein [Candidatus Aminicenantes bacterium]NIM77526.1 acyltransferase domain-containing protein [Candidatus Aminicenantes bacterium]NIN16842.1 acyltransferase domain-containing protein [Candidatus Aminicenantes bacterium]NIN40720.1 acyltransferase domain-containing protein [Candidatus Aminicenantes bacterium]NIN83529.1 acyltransferase domain-containing protein [Candidatus Aminicenantes bacterium]
MSEIHEDNNRTGLEIAVIGMAGRFPGAKDIHEFWNNLKNGVEAISFFTDGELVEAGIDPGLVKNRHYVKAKGVLEGIEYFDASFFDYSTWEAEVMDPQFRVLHECCWEALEDAGYAGGVFAGAVGLYVGSIYNSYWLERISTGIDAHSQQIRVGSFNDRDFISTRLAYKLDLKGPAVTVQTACSTSLVSIHLGCQALLSGECDIVLAGGVSILLPGKNGYLYEDGMVRSSDGHCRAFDEKANGTNGGDGVGIVVLKTLENALRAGDCIHAIIRGSAINNDGVRKVGYTAPSVEGEAEVIEAALQVAEVDAESIGYVETHGTGTALGDPVEIEGLKRAFNSQQTGFCAIGSVKTNVGHLDATAGAAGFIKTVLVLKHRLIPPSLNFETSNPKIDFENSPFYVVTEPREWKKGPFPRRAGVSSFGIGGTNVHVIVEEGLGLRRSDGQMIERPQLILLSARTETALDRMTENLVNYLKENHGLKLADAAYTLQVGRKTFKHRRYFVCTGIEEAVEMLSASNGPCFCAEDNRHPVVFMFPGQGSQYVNMGRELYETEPLFREEMDRCFESLTSIMECDIKEIIYPYDLSVSSVSSVAKNIKQTEIAQPLLFAIEYALAKMLMKWGIRPYAMMGHSIGEYTAACLSGVFCLEEALELVVLRGKLMQKMPSGSMLSMNIPEDELRHVLAANEEISLAAVNGPQLCVVSGAHQAVDAFEKELKEKGYTGSRLHTSHAFHSNMMEPILAEFKQGVGRIRLREPEMPYISNISGTWITLEDAVDPGYWARQLRQTVRFGKGLEEVLKTDNAVFVEVGPGRALSTLVNKHPGKNPGHRVVNLLRHPQENIPDDRYFLDRIGWLWTFGISIDWEAFHQDRERRRLPLPTTPLRVNVTGNTVNR